MHISHVPHRSWLIVLCWIALLALPGIGLLSSGQVHASNIPQPTASRSRQEDPTSCPLASRLVVGETGRIIPGPANNVRSTPSAAGQLLGQIPGGEVFTVLEGPVCGDSNIVWWRVSYNDLTGWTGEGQNLDYWAEPWAAPIEESLAPPPLTIGSTDWSLLVYEMAGNGNLIEISGSGAPTILPMPNCFMPPMNEAYHNWQQNILTVSPDRRFAAFTFPSAAEEIWVTIADAQTDTCFTATVPDVIPAADPHYNLGVFSPDGTAFAFGWTDTPQGATGMIVIVDLIDNPGQILHTRLFEGSYPIPVEWRAEGIYLIEAHLYYEPYPNTGGQLQVWDPASDTIIGSDEAAYQGLSISQLAHTGEVIGAAHSDEFLQDTMDYGAPGNVLLYSTASTHDDPTVVYHNPLDYAVRRAYWVHDGEAVLVQSNTYGTSLYYDEPSPYPVSARLIFRNGTVRDIELPANTTFLAGTPNGWLMLLHGSPLRLQHAQYVDDALSITSFGTLFDAYGLIAIETPTLGATVTEEFTPMAGVESFRLSNCSNLNQFSYLFRLEQGHANPPQTLYAEPSASSLVLGSFGQFTVLNGPLCPDGTYWWLLETSAGTGWASEGTGSDPIMRLNCPSSGSHWAIGDQTTFEPNDPNRAFYLYSKPMYLRDKLGQINPGDSITVLEGPVCDSRTFWWKVDLGGLTGWIEEPLSLG